MRTVRITLALTATAAALLAGPVSADDPIEVCRTNGVYDGCTYIHTDEPCVDGGGRIADRTWYMFYPCH